MTKPNAKRAVERCEALAKLGAAPTWWRVFALRKWLRAYRSIMALDISEMGEMLREVYPAAEVERMANRPNPMLVRSRATRGSV